jgi:hypothetical protein
MKKLITLFFLSFLLIEFCEGQVTFQKTYGGSTQDEGWCVRQTSDGGFIITGFTNDSLANYDAYLVKTDSLGDTLWTKTFGGANYDNGYSVIQTNDGGFIMAGTADGIGIGYSDFLLVKLDSIGNTEWLKLFGGIYQEVCHSVQQTSDGGYIMAGTATGFGAGNQDIYVVKTDTSGDVLWSKTFGGGSNDLGECIRQTTDGGYIICGTAASFDTSNYSLYLIRTDANGDSLWTKIIKDGINSFNGINVQQTTDGGFVITGNYYYYMPTNYNIYLTKIDSSGNLLWFRKFGGNISEIAYCVQQTMDGGFVITGGTYSGSQADGFLIKTDTSGNLTWNKTYGGGNYDAFYSMQQTSDNGYILSGFTENFGNGSRNIYLVKTDSSGNSGCNQANPVMPSGSMNVFDLDTPSVITSPTTLVASPSVSIGTRGTIYTPCLSLSISNVNHIHRELSVYPNPVHPISLITFTYPSTSVKKEIIIYSIHEKEIARYNLPQWSSTQTVKLPEMAAGVYVARMAGEGASAMVKFVITQ